MMYQLGENPQQHQIRMMRSDTTKDVRDCIQALHPDSQLGGMQFEGEGDDDDPNAVKPDPSSWESSSTGPQKHASELWWWTSGRKSFSCNLKKKSGRNCEQMTID
jgi:hypothetical protein